MKHQALIWEPDPLQARYLALLFSNDGYTVTTLTGYLQLRQAAQMHLSVPCAIVISLGPEPEQTLRRCKQLHKHFPFSTLIVISPYQEQSLSLAAFAAGADDYLISPLQPDDLLARTRAHLQRSATILAAKVLPPAEAVLQFGPLTLDPNTYDAQLGHQTVSLSELEFRLLLLLGRQANQLLSREQLHQQLWQSGPVPGSRRLDNFMLALRQKLPKSEQLEIKTIYGKGYCLKIKPDQA